MISSSKCAIGFVVRKLGQFDTHICICMHVFTCVALEIPFLSQNELCSLLVIVFRIEQLDEHGCVYH